MTDLPFGFNTGNMPDDVSSKIPLFAEIQRLLAAGDGPVNWELARQVAIAACGSDDPPADGPVERDAVEALRLADLWLDPVTTLPTGVRSAEAWTRVHWVEATLPAWQTLCDPVAARVVGVMQQSVPEELRAQAAPLLGVMGQLGAMLFGAQVGQAIGALAGEVVGSTDVGFPLTPGGRAALLPAGVAAFGAGLEVPDAEVRLYLALREAAHQRLYQHVPWLRAHVLGAIEAYARGITVDSDAIERAMRDVDPTNPESLQAALGGELFTPERTPAQQAALDRLETALALVEGWVDDVVAAAADGHLPGAQRLAETVRRRRATGGPAEQTFATLVGLELRPRRLREAAALWRALREARGIEGRDGVWSHPDLLPGASDLDDPAAYVESSGAADPDRDGLE